MKKLLFLCLALGPALALAQSYSINWYKISGGGGASAGGSYQITGTIGQHDASGPMTGDTYSLSGGFWAIYAVQTAGAPTLYITQSPNTVTVFWQNVSGWSLQQKGSLNLAGGWSASSGVTTLKGTNYLNVTPPTANEFYRLTHP